MDRRMAAAKAEADARKKLDSEEDRASTSELTAVIGSTPLDEEVSARKAKYRRSMMINPEGMGM